jgi:cytochrome c5
MKRILLSTVVYLSLAGFAFATPEPQDSQPAKAKTHAGTSQNNKTPATGEEVFMAHCQRCHTPPSAIRPRITGSVIMHMRVRARLSRQDEELLLKYLAP